MKLLCVLLVVAWLGGAECHEHHDDDDYDPNAPPENKLNREGFVRDKT